MTRTFPTVALAAMLATGMPAGLAAQTVLTPAQWRMPGGRADAQRAFDDGYRSGLREGERDARSGRRPDYRQHDEFRRGSSGWGWGGGNNRQAGADLFRRGFAEGYQAGYERYRRDAYGYPGDRMGRPWPGSGYPGGGYGYPGGGYGYPGSGYGGSPAEQRGFEDGYREGLDDARDRDRYEPTRKKDYREGDDGYNSRYGSREQYKHIYRQAFQQGYDRGYREGRYRE